MSGDVTCQQTSSSLFIAVYEVPCIFWRYINVDEVSLITLKKLLQIAMELLQIATAQFITKFDGQLLQIATAFLLQSATGITKCDDYYKLRQYSSHCPGDVAVYALGTGKAVWYSVSVNCCCLLMLQLEITCQSVHTLLTERQFFSSSYISVTDKVLALAEG